MNELRNRILLSVQRALVGNVIPTMRAVLVQINDDCAKIKVFNDGSIPEYLLELASEIESEILADFEEKTLISVEIERLDAPAPIPKENCIWVFARRE